MPDVAVVSVVMSGAVAIVVPTVTALAESRKARRSSEFGLVKTSYGVRLSTRATPIITSTCG